MVLTVAFSFLLIFSLAAVGCFVAITVITLWLHFCDTFLEDGPIDWAATGWIDPPTFTTDAMQLVEDFHEELAMLPDAEPRAW